MKEQPATRPTLLFIPDISGFTRFVNETEITHSQHIIEELLEVLIDANEIGLEISEIEGDAILFYRKGQTPTAVELLAQIQRMYVRFHAHLKLYETHRICQCGACCTANDLALKFVVHFGDIGQKQVKDFSKLFGRDVIVAHRLMKNEVPFPEYVLFTHQLMNACTTWVDVEQVAWSEPESGEERYDVGTVKYCYIPLEPLMSHVPEPKIEDYSLPGSTSRVMECDAVIEAPIEQVFDVLSDLTVRHEWMVNLKGSDQFNSKITRQGSSHRCIVKETEKDPTFIAHDFKIRDDLITFTESNRRDGIAAVYSLRKIGEHLTRLELFYFMQKNLIKELMVKLFMQKKLKQEALENLDGLNAFCKRLADEGKNHTARILLKPAA